MSRYYLAPLGDGTPALWADEGPDDQFPEPIAHEQQVSPEHWTLLLRGAGLDEQPEPPWHVTADPWLCRCAAAELGPGGHESYCGQADNEVQL